MEPWRCNIKSRTQWRITGAFFEHHLCAEQINVGRDTALALRQDLHLVIIGKNLSLNYHCMFTSLNYHCMFVYTVLSSIMVWSLYKMVLGMFLFNWLSWECIQCEWMYIKCKNDAGDLLPHKLHYSHTFFGTILILPLNLLKVHLMLHSTFSVFPLRPPHHIIYLSEINNQAKLYVN